MLYILEGKNPIHEDDIIKWGTWFKTADRVVAQTRITDETEVSTVFLGLDHSYPGSSLPLLFETMVFGGKLNEEQVRYSTWDQAEAGHEAVVKLVKLAEGLA